MKVLFQAIPDGPAIFVRTRATVGQVQNLHRFMSQTFSNFLLLSLLVFSFFFPCFAYISKLKSVLSSFGIGTVFKIESRMAKIE